jgi:hypothetical protein
MSTFAVPQTRAALRDRIVALRPDAPRQWGRMTPHQMICHLADGFRMASGERPPKPVDNVFSRFVIRWVALHTSMKWPPGAKTIPEADQEKQGTPPAQWESDKLELLRLFDAFAARPAVAHPFFGALNGDEWNVWAYRHVDHHLRQFRS